MHFLLEDGLRTWFYTNPEVAQLLPGLKKDIAQLKISPTAAADRLLALLKR